MFVRQVLACLVAAFVASPAAAADAPPLLELSKAWTPAAGRTGADVPLYVTIANHGSEPDSLLRVRCPVANFSEQRTTDYGEGAPASREIKSIPIPANQTVVLAPGGYHLMLLKTTQPLEQGQTFSCSLTFKNGGRQDVSVTTAAEGAQSAP
ncbi:MAG TPA: copper chaperone PCu(A)C [Thermoanaerobaculia bacterium]|jgi:copper(I)-binding protein